MLLSTGQVEIGADPPAWVIHTSVIWAAMQGFLLFSFEAGDRIASSKKATKKAGNLPLTSTDVI
jgi:hypothetical protein